MKESETISRSKNLVLNVFTGFLSQFIALVLSFVGRKIFVSFLPLEYLGINGLYTNILTVLSITEMGLDSAFIYMLYKPINENNYQLVSTLLNYFRKIYIKITGILVGIALCLMTVLKYIVKIDDGIVISEKELIIYYLLFLFNTIIPYLFARYTILLSADQHGRIKHVLTIVTNLMLQVLHIVVLYVFKSYIIYVIATVIMTIIHCIMLRVVTRRKYTAYFVSTTPVDFDKSIIKQKVKSTIVYKFGAVAVNNTDNILISVLVSTKAVGLYSNYSSVIAAVQGLIAIVSVSLLSGLGNLYSTDGNADSKRVIFFSQLFIYHLMGSIGFIGIYFLMDKFVAIWLGEKFILDKCITFSIALNFYLSNAIGPIWINREANGLFERVKYLMIINVVINLSFLIILGKMYGIFGIILATSLSVILTNFWVEPKILFNTVFHETSISYWKKQGMYFFITICIFALVSFFDSIIGAGIIMLILETILIFVLCLVLFSLVVKNSKEGIFMLQRVKYMINAKIKNKGENNNE